MAQRPRDALIDRKLGTWQVVERVVALEGRSGGNFSAGYVAVDEETGHRGFVKAMDLHDAESNAVMNGTSAFDEAYGLLRDYRFERDLLIQCRETGVRRIVVAREHGELQLDESNPLMSTVGYLIFDEAAENIRDHISDHDFDLVWNLLTLKDVALALHELHSRRISHQDVKPSNVLLFMAATMTQGSNHSVKLSDLGSAHMQTEDYSPRGDKVVPGDRAYAPPELLYRHIDGDWTRRIRTDLYTLGNLTAYLFANVTINALLERFLPPEYHWDSYRGSYSYVLPEILHAFSQALDQVNSDIPDEVRDEVLRAIRGACHPDPSERGFIGGRLRARNNQYDTQPFATLFAELAYKASHGLLRVT